MVRRSCVHPSWMVMICLLLTLTVTAVAGCVGTRPPQGDGGGGTTDPPGAGETDPSEVVLVLYFGNDGATALERETRVVRATEGETYETLALLALIDGPHREDLARTIPDGTRLLSLDISDRLAYVNFSREFVDNHWGGSTGEVFTICSVVNTLTESNLVTVVRFLVEGEPMGSLAGHIDLEEFTRNEDIIAGSN